jgi:hypothetical protein
MFFSLDFLYIVPETSLLPWILTITEIEFKQPQLMVNQGNVTVITDKLFLYM